jgi:hypothetical protein
MNRRNTLRSMNKVVRAQFSGRRKVARIFHESSTATVDMAVLLSEL